MSIYFLFISYVKSMMFVFVFLLPNVYLYTVYIDYDSRQLSLSWSESIAGRKHRNTEQLILR